MSRRLLLLSGLTAVAVASTLVLTARSGDEAVAATAPAPDPAPAVVEIASAELRDTGGVAWVPASVVSRNDARLAGEVPGRLVLVAEVGAEVGTGDVVARIDDASLRLELADAEALVGRRRAETAQAERQFERLRALKDSRLVAASQIDEAGSGLEIRRRELVQAEVGRDRARQRLAQATVRAPHAGVVVERLAQVGEYLQAGAPVARLVQTAEVELSARAPAGLARDLQPGQQVAVRQDGATLEAHIRAVVPAADLVSRQVELRLSVAGGHWLVGSAAEVALPQMATAMEVAVPRDALVLRAEGNLVFRLRDDGTVERVPVQVGDIAADWVGVAGAVAVGDRLVIRGAERLSDGQAVTVRVRLDEIDQDAALAVINTAMTAG